MKIRKSHYLVAVLVILFSLAACDGKSGYKDGTYTGEYSEKEGIVNMQVELTIENNKITACSMKAYGKDGKVKDETYGDGLDDKNKELAKLAYQGFSQYADLLVEKQDISEVDAISGATVSYKEFKAAVEDALSKAK